MMMGVCMISLLVLDHSDKLECPLVLFGSICTGDGNFDIIKLHQL